MSALLIGVGSTDRGDDGIGIAVAREAARREVRGVEVIQVPDPASLVDVWDGLDRVVVVDAMSSRRPPGTVTTVDVTEAPLPEGGWAAGGTHALGLAAAVELSRALDRLPRRLVVVGVEAAQVAHGAELSPEVARAVGPATDAALLAVSAGGT